MVDAEKLGKEEINDLFEKGLDANSIKDLRTEQSFFLMELWIWKFLMIEAKLQWDLYDSD